MSDNKTKPTKVSIETFLSSLEDKRREEANILIQVMKHVSGLPPVMWGPSIIGFGTQHYKYDTGREGDMPILGFSPRKTAITVYITESFDHYSDLLAKLGKHKISVACLYINKLEDIDLEILRLIIERSYHMNTSSLRKPETVDEYIDQVPAEAKNQFNELRMLVLEELTNANEVVSYGIVGYKVDDKRARVFISGWKDHTAMYPIPKDEALIADLKPYIKGKGTLWFPLDKPLPKSLLKKVVKVLAR